MAITLSEIRTRIRQRTDNENSSFVSDTELTQLVNTEYKELYGLLIRYSLQRSENTQSISANGSTSYPLNSDFYSLIGVFRSEGSVRVRLGRHGERFRPGTTVGTASTYRIQNSSLVLYPNPSSGTYEVIYIPVPATLVADGDTLDGVLGWEELVVIACAIKVLDKEETNADHLRRDKAELMRRIQDEAAAVEFTENWVIENVRGVSSRYNQADLLEGMYLDRSGVRRWPW